MCNEIAKIYEAKSAAHMFFPLSLENPHKQQASTLFKTHISDLAFNLIGINNSSTLLSNNPNLKK